MSVHEERLLGVRVMGGSMGDAVAHGLANVGKPEPAVIMTVATWTLVRANRDPEFFGALTRAVLVMPDGWPLLILSRLKGGKIRERVTGADSIRAFAQACAAGGLHMVLFGSAPGVAQSAAERLRAAFAGLSVTAITPPMKVSFDQDDAREMADQLRATGAQVVFVGISVPKGEVLADRIARLMPGTLFVCVGGGLDNAAGLRARAPAWVQRLWLEWLFRILQDPKGKLPSVFEAARHLPRLVLRDLKVDRHGAGGT